MPCVLQISFTGLCLYLEHTDRQQVAVLQPDCRVAPGIDRLHKDGTQGVPHVGYLRFDLANLDFPNLNDTIPSGTGEEGPRYEVVYRFNRQELTFDPPPGADPITGTLELPRFEKIANEADPASTPQMPLPPLPRLEMLPHLFSRDALLPPPRALLMRMILRGGQLTADGREFWKFSRLFSRPDPKTYTDAFKSVATWIRAFPTEGVRLVIADFDGRNAVTIPLKPATPGGVISLKIANLCSENPLEWEEYDPRLVRGDDHDFKWLYRLQRPARGKTWEELLLGSLFPIPERTTDGGGLGVEDCFGGVVGGQTFP